MVNYWIENKISVTTMFISSTVKCLEIMSQVMKMQKSISLKVVRMCRCKYFFSSNIVFIKISGNAASQKCDEAIQDEE